MAKIHPDQALSLSPYLTSQRETFTIWLKSLVCHTNGCTVYNSDGQIVFRVDNYDKKCSNEVHLMDLQGKVLYTIRKKKLQAFGGWDGYRCIDHNDDHSNYMMNKEKPWFQVKRNCKMLMGSTLANWEITVGNDKFRILRFDGKAGFKIVNLDGNIVAEAKQKQSSCGVVLGDDVLSLKVEPRKDHSLVMALVIVYGLITRKM